MERCHARRQARYCLLTGMLTIMVLTHLLTTTRPPSTASAWATRTSRSSTPCSTRNASRSLWRTRSSEPHLTCYEAACLESTIVPDNCFVFEDGVEKGLFGNFRLSRLLRSIVGFRLLRAELRLSVRRSVLRPRTPHRPRMGQSAECSNLALDRRCHGPPQLYFWFLIS